MTPPDDTPGLDHKLILVVDDSDELLEFYAMLLEPLKHSIVTARTGHEALDRIREKRPDAIIADIVMPGMDGLELLERIRSDFAPPLPPVIVCTGFDITEDEARNRGATMFLSKPVRPADLRTAIQTALLGTKDAEQLQASGREWASAARRRTIERAAAAVKSVHVEDLRERARSVLWTIPGYFGVDGAFIALMHGDILDSLGSAGTPTLGDGEDLGARFPACFDILCTGSSLLVHDAAGHPCFASSPAALGGMRFFAGVPLVTTEKIPVGTICLFNREPHDFSGEDLGILEEMGRRGSHVLARTTRALPTNPSANGIFPRAVVEPTIDLELQTARRLGDSCELAVVDTATGEGFAAAVTLVRAAVSPTRLVVGRLSRRRLAVFKRGSADVVGPEMARAIADLHHSDDVLGVGVVSLEAVQIRLLTAAALLDIADRAKVASVESGGRVERYVVARTDVGA